MDRVIWYSGEVPLSRDFLQSEVNAMKGIGWLARAVLGTTTLVDSLTCTPTSPTSLSVIVTPGAIYQLANVDDSAYSTLGTDTVHQIVKQGLLETAQTLTFVAPGTTGYAQNFLIQAAFSEADGGSLVLPYYNAANPAVAWSGPGGSGTAQYTRRQDLCVISSKAGAAATSGSQTTPTPDIGNVGLFVITVAYGQSTITTGNITTLTTAPFIPVKLPGVPAGVQSGAWTSATAGGTANALTATLSPNLSALTAGLAVWIAITTTNTGAATLNLNGLGATAIVRHNGTAIGAGELLAGAVELVFYDGTSFRLSATATKARSWYFKTPSGTIPASVETRIANWSSSTSNMPASTINASAGTITIGAADAGVYVVGAGAAVTSATIVDIVAIRVNGVDVVVQSMQSPSNVTAQDPGCAGIIVVAAGDVVDATYFQTQSGGGSNSLAGAGNYFNGVRIGD